jgi:tRNA uridine 5-carbamoylmethylation protein Kti12
MSETSDGYSLDERLEEIRTEVDQKLSDLRTTVESKLGEIQELVRQAVNDLSARVDELQERWEAHFASPPEPPQ